MFLPSQTQCMRLLNILTEQQGSALCKGTRKWLSIGKPKKKQILSWHQLEGLHQNSISETN